MSDAIFPEGIYFKKPREGAPTFVKGDISIQPEKLYQWAKNHVNEKGYINIDLKISRENKLYLQLNTFNGVKKSEGEATQEELKTDKTTYQDDGVTKTIPF